MGISRGAPHAPTQCAGAHMQHEWRTFRPTCEHAPKTKGLR